MTHFIQSLHLNGVKDSTCDPHIEKEALQVYLYMPQTLSFVGGCQGSRLIENGSNWSREGFLLPVTTAYIIQYSNMMYKFVA